ncbi:MAG: hypothetical protein WA658_06305, partial [Candidatus Acidiferrales bacterium]
LQFQQLATGTPSARFFWGCEMLMRIPSPANATTDTSSDTSTAATFDWVSENPCGPNPAGALPRARP